MQFHLKHIYQTKAISSPLVRKGFYGIFNIIPISYSFPRELQWDFSKVKWLSCLQDIGEANGYIHLCTIVEIQKKHWLITHIGLYKNLNEANL